ncbi:hypothetical protein [Nocardia sp. XZ_19_231]|uniref:hypothetical protein n=1 Tax=Nocardia sp. XZ_19_231 TaxID=2769252 RepID=UPI00188E3BF1|nr:hypothetical protein [Nocardia sp. XZ_19_231]
MNRSLSRTVAAAGIALAMATFPAIASASSATVPTVAQPIVNGAPTPPFDPICPLCFVREALESLSAQ